jgi:predicted esterase YcpF (UPF0227 family)
MTPQPNLLYLHGFNSSPRAAKAALIAHYISANNLPIAFHTPWMPSQPRHAANTLDQLVGALGEPLALVGSSLGGFYAAWLAQRYGLRAVLINPSAYPFRRMQQYLGSNENPYSGEKYELEQADFDALALMDVPQFQDPSRCLLLSQSGDEVLDYREALDKWPQCPRQVEQGGSHQFEHFERWVPAVLDFLFPKG